MQGSYFMFMIWKFCTLNAEEPFKSYGYKPLSVIFTNTVDSRYLELAYLE